MPIIVAAMDVFISWFGQRSRAAGRVSAHSTEADDKPHYAFYLMCDDLKNRNDDLAAKGVLRSAITESRWCSITSIHIAGGGELGLHQPKHPTALDL